LLCGLLDRDPHGFRAFGFSAKSVGDVAQGRRFAQLANEAHRLVLREMPGPMT
jgi:hypothetical protein